MPCPLLLFYLTAHRGFSLLGFTKWNGGICRGIIFSEVRHGKKGFYGGNTRMHNSTTENSYQYMQVFQMVPNLLKEMV